MAVIVAEGDDFAFVHRRVRSRLLHLCDADQGYYREGIPTVSVPAAMMR